MEREIAIAALDALAHESRIDIFRLLVQAGEAGMPAGKIGEQLGIAGNTVKNHLVKALKYIREYLGKKYGNPIVLVLITFSGLSF